MKLGLCETHSWSLSPEVLQKCFFFDSQTKWCHFLSVLIASRPFFFKLPPPPVSEGGEIINLFDPSVKERPIGSSLWVVFFSAFWLAAWRSSPISSAFSEDRCTRFYCEVPKNWQNKSLFLVHFVQKSSSGFNSSTFKPFQMKSVTVIAPFSFWNVEAQNFGNNWFIFRLREEVRCTAFCRLISYFCFGPNLFCVSKSWTVRPLSTGLNKP